MKYTDYLQSEEWKEKRKRIWRRAKGKCERCSFRNGSHVHLTYARIYCERDEDLALYCKPCHEFVHLRLKVDPRNLDAYLDMMLREI